MFEEGQIEYCESGLNEFYCEAFSTLPAPILVFEEKTFKIIDVNKMAVVFYGYSREELLNLTMLDISIEIEDTKRSVAQAIDGMLSHIPIRYHRKKNGEIIPVEILPTVAVHQGKNVLCGVVKDISRQMFAEKSLRKSERKYSTLLSNMPGIAYRGLNDDRRTMEFISDRSGELLGYLPEMITSKKSILSYSEVIHPEDRYGVLEQINDAIERQEQYEFVYRIVTADETIQYVWEQGTGVYDNKGDLTFLEGFITNVTEQKKLEFDLQKENRRLRSSVRQSSRFGDIIGKSEKMGEVYDHLLKASITDASVIIYGESGTGKEMAARAVHDLSDRKEKPFIIVNCGAIPHDLLESEFFGYKKGAFTGASFDKVGYLDSADGGTLFLDEVGDISLSMQVKLLRAIDGGGYTPLGGRGTKYPDLRIICATNKDLKELVQKGDIREDFFYRIHVLSVKMPPLRERTGDIALLTHHFVQLYSNNTVFTIQPTLLKGFENYQWPGNVRELKNVIMRYIALKSDPVDEVYDLDLLLEASSVSPSAIDNDVSYQAKNPELKSAMDEFEKRHLLETLNKQRWHLGRTAGVLGIHQKTLARKMKRYGIV